MGYERVMPPRSEAIHVATIRRRYKDKVYETHLLRRSYREDGKVKHETLGNISHLPSHVVELVRRSLAGERFFAEGEAEVVRTLPHGHVEVVLGVLRDLGLDKVLLSRPSRQRQIALALVVARVLFPASKLATTRLWEETTLLEELGLGTVGVREAYDALDWLLSRKEAIERALVKRCLPTGSLVLYDLSSSYMTGTKCSLAKRGYSRDHRSDLPQVTYGVVTDAEGRPVAVEVFEGNVKDCATVLSQVERLRERFQLRRLVLVGDRGMISNVQIDLLKKHPGVDWVTALRNPEVAEMNAQGVLQIGLFDETNLIELAMGEGSLERRIACRNPSLATLRAQVRESLLKATELRLRKVEAAVAAGRLKDAGAIGERVGRCWRQQRMRKHFVVEVSDGHFSWSRDQASIDREAAMDGIYVIRTSLPADDPRGAPDEVVRTYKRLSGVERVFRRMKTTELLVRPIHHRDDNRVRAHIFVCMIAAHVTVELERRLGSLLFRDEALAEAAPTRDPVAPPIPSVEGRRKKAEKLTTDNLPVHSLRTLLDNMASRTRVTLRLPGVEGTAVVLATPTEWQQKVLDTLRASSAPPAAAPPA